MLFTHPLKPIAGMAVIMLASAALAGRPAYRRVPSTAAGISGTAAARQQVDGRRAHELGNLYVTDGSFMPTSGSVPYTWTIYANAFRVADRLGGNRRKHT